MGDFEIVPEGLGLTSVRVSSSGDQEPRKLYFEYRRDGGTAVLSLERCLSSSERAALRNRDSHR